MYLVTFYHWRPKLKRKRRLKKRGRKKTIKRRMEEKV